MTGQKLRKATALNLHQKVKIIAECEARTSNAHHWTQADICKWAKLQFELPAPPSASSISRILQDKDSLKQKASRDGNASHRKRKGNLKSSAVEYALAECVLDCHSRGVFVSGMAVQEQGKRLLSNVNDALPQKDRINLKFSNGWLQGFQKRHDFKSYKSHGESGDADDAAIARELPQIQAKLSMYNPEDIWNADEFGLFYQMAPTRTIGPSALPGRKKQKARMTFLACTNGSGTEKFPMMIIGKSRRPRCFQKKTGQELGFDYWHNSKAWMTSSLFYDWLARFDSFIGRKEGRKAILLPDNCSAHGKVDTLPRMSNVEVLFLPPNTTSKIQPMDAGVIACIKMRYRRLQISRALDSEEVDSSKFYKVSQILAMRWIASIWNGLESDVIRNCWKSTGILETLEVATDTSSSLQAERTELEELVTSITPPDTRMNIENFLCPAEEDDCTSSCTVEYLTDNVLGSLADGGVVEADCDSAVEDDGEDREVSVMTVTEKLRHLSLAIRILDYRGICPAAARKPLLEAQRDMWKEHKQGLKQTKMTDFFKPPQ